MIVEQKKILGMLIIALFALSCLYSTGLASAKPATINVYSGQSTIQAAIDAANPGDTIVVNEGTYQEMVSVNKPLTIIGMNAVIETPKIYGFIIQAPATVSGFKIYPMANTGDHYVGIQFGSPTPYYGGVASNNEVFSGFLSSGISVDGPSGITIKNNIIHSSSAGISTWQVKDISIIGNVIDSFGNGIVTNGPNTVIANNQINSGPGEGIYVNGQYQGNERSENLVIKNNNIVSSYYGIEIVYKTNCQITGNRIVAGEDAICLEIFRSSNVIVSGNTLINSFSGGLSRALNMGECNNVIVTGNKINVVEWGMTFGTLTSAVIAGNEITVGPKIIDGIHYGTYGIILGASFNCVISNNIIRGAQYAGIWVDSSHDLIIQNNKMTSDSTGSVQGIRLATDVSNTYVSGNNIAGAYFYGIYIAYGANTNTIFRNTIALTGNIMAGIGLDESTFANFVKNNKISGAGVPIDDLGQNTIIP